MTITPLLEKHRDKWCENEEGCYIWTGTTNGVYGAVGINGKMKSVHRLVLIEKMGPPEEGQVARHTCKNKCVNPDHLLWGSMRDNNLDRGLEALREGSNKMNAARMQRAKGWVYAAERKKPYRARGVLEGKLVHLGDCSTPEEATAKYEAFLLKQRGFVRT